MNRSTSDTLIRRWLMGRMAGMAPSSMSRLNTPGDSPHILAARGTLM